MSDEKIFVGNNAKDCKTSDKFDGYTKVVINVDEEHYFEAGNDTGRTLTISNPWGTQEMANDILASLNGYEYQPYEATAIIDPAAEIGDGVTLTNVYGGIYSQETDFGKLMVSTLSADKDEEIDHEYPYEQKENREIVRKIANTKTAIEQTINSITLTVEQADGTITEIKLAEGGQISLKGLVTFTDLATAGQTVINGGNITTGTINADSIKAKSITADYIANGSITGGSYGLLAPETIENANLDYGCVSYGKTSFTGTLDQVGTNASNISAMNGYFTGSAAFSQLKCSGYMYLNGRRCSADTITINGQTRNVVVWVQDS